MTQGNRTCRFTDRKYRTRKTTSWSPKDLYLRRSVYKSSLLNWKHHGDRGQPVLLVLAPGMQGTGCGVAAQMGGVRRREGPRLCHLHAHSPTPPEHRHASCKQQTWPSFPCKRQRAGEI